MITISEERLETLLREELRRAIRELRPQIAAEIARSLQLIDEAGGILILNIKGRNPARSFRRLMKKYEVPFVKLGAGGGWKRCAIEKLIDERTLPAPRKSLRLAA